MWNRASLKVITIALAVAAVSPSSCTGAIREVPAKQFSDDVVAGTRKLFGLADDAAAKRALEDALTRTGRSVDEISFAALRWSARINRVSDTILARVSETPETNAAIRSFIVGSTCEAIEKSQQGQLTAAQVRAIVDEQRVKSSFPSIVGEAEMLRDITVEIVDALEEGDLLSSFPGVAQLFICNGLGG